MDLEREYALRKAVVLRKYRVEREEIGIIIKRKIERK
jgi:hypothetical protein